MRRVGKEAMAPLLQEMYGDVSRKETEKEPRRIVAIERTDRPNMVQFYRLDGVMEAVDDKRLEREEYGSAYQTRRQVGNEQPLRLVGAVLSTVAQHTLVKIACFEEEERHEKV